jgi:2-polyprenyl-3-methyl-5-hydroxy-6-metoxy-1,4-benzoquinol methylase
MPTSFPFQINEILLAILNIQPQSVLDVGTGFGKYGFLAREYLDIMQRGVKKKNWKTVIDGVEVFENYITPAHKFIYNNIFVGNALEVLPSIRKKYDLILLIDILEHLTHKEAKKLLSLVKAKSKHILIATPKKVLAQNEVFGNIHEIHISQFDKSHFREFDNISFIPHNHSLIIYIGNKAKQFNKLFSMQEIVKKSIL